MSFVATDQHVMLWCDSDVLALASALCLLGTSLRAVRTALWCALQLTCADLPLASIHKARQTANRHLVLTIHHGHGKTHSATAGGPADLWEHADDLLSDGEEIPEEDETGDGESHQLWYLRLTSSMQNCIKKIFVLTWCVVAASLHSLYFIYRVAPNRTVCPLNGIWKFTQNNPVQICNNDTVFCKLNPKVSLSARSTFCKQLKLTVFQQSFPDIILWHLTNYDTHSGPRSGLATYCKYHWLLTIIMSCNVCDIVRAALFYQIMDYFWKLLS